MRLPAVAFCALLLPAALLTAPGCVDDECDPCCDHWGCVCPNGNCVDGCCVDWGQADCLYPPGTDYQGWPNDSDLEPNDHPGLAVVLPCADDGVVGDATEYAGRCPDRTNLTNGFLNVLICPEGDRDFYAVYLLEDETVTFDVVFELDSALRRDLDAAVWTWDLASDSWREDVASATSTDVSEQLSLNTGPGSFNPEGWYYLMVHGKTPEDLNYYTVGFTLNATP